MRDPRAGMYGVPSSAAPSTSVETNWPCQWSCSGVGVVVNFDRDRLAFLEPQERARELAVVGDGGNDAVFGDFDGAGLDAQGVVGRRLRARRKGFHQPWCW